MSAEQFSLMLVYVVGWMYYVIYYKYYETFYLGPWTTKATAPIYFLW